MDKGSVHFVQGDIIGCYIQLDEYNPLNNHIRYYKNGIDLGIAFTNNKTISYYSKCQVIPNNQFEIPSAVYYPAISLYQKVCMYMQVGFDDL